MSQVAGELQNPRKSFPRAMVITLVLMILSVIIPVMVAVSIAPDYHKWTDGYDRNPSHPPWPIALKYATGI